MSPRSDGAPGASALIALPDWAQAGERRRAHVLRVEAMLAAWADALGVGDDERTAWRDAALWHDALRDAPEAELRALAGGDAPAELLHGPAVAARLERAGETRRDVLEAIRYHTVGYAGWGRTGRALYMADFLEPGRKFSRRDRAFLASHVPNDFDGVFRQVVRTRMEWLIREGHALLPETVALWNGLR